MVAISQRVYPIFTTVRETQSAPNTNPQYGSVVKSGTVVGIAFFLFLFIILLCGYYLVGYGRFAPRPPNVHAQIARGTYQRWQANIAGRGRSDQRNQALNSQYPPSHGLPSTSTLVVAAPSYHPNPSVETIVVPVPPPEAHLAR